MIAPLQRVEGLGIDGSSPAFYRHDGWMESSCHSLTDLAQAIPGLQRIDAGLIHNAGLFIPDSRNGDLFGVVREDGVVDNILLVRLEEWMPAVSEPEPEPGVN